MKPKKTPHHNYMHIGSDICSVQEARKAIMEIITLPCSDAVKLAAIEAFNRICNVEVHVDGNIVLGPGGAMSCGDTVKK